MVVAARLSHDSHLRSDYFPPSFRLRNIHQLMTRTSQHNKEDICTDVLDSVRGITRNGGAILSIYDPRCPSRHGSSVCSRPAVAPDTLQTALTATIMEHQCGDVSCQITDMGQMPEQDIIVTKGFTGNAW